MAQTNLKLSALVYGVLWTAFMALWSGAYDPIYLVLLVLAGALNALAWYWLMGKWFRWQEARRSPDAR